MIRARAIIGKFDFSSAEAASYLKYMNSAMIEAFAVIRETNKYQYRRLLQLVKGKITITNERKQTTSFLLLMLFFFVRIAIEKALKRPKMRSFEGARRRREKFWGILRVWEKKLITFPPLLIADLKQGGESYNKLS